MINIVFVLFILESILLFVNWMEFVERRGKDE